VTVMCLDYCRKETNHSYWRGDFWNCNYPRGQDSWGSASETHYTEKERCRINPLQIKLY